MNAAAMEHDQKISLNDQLRDKYQLKTEPFSEATHLFFQGAQRQHNLETLRHLVSYGDMVLLLTGEAGSGKSTLLAELGKHLADGVRMISLKPSLIASPRKLAHELCKHLDMQQIEGEPVSRTMERVLEVCAHNAATGERLLLVLDDAHKTNGDSFKVLLSAFKGLGGDAGICLLVSGRPDILQSVTYEGVDPATCSWIHQIHLKPFSQEDAETYVSLRLIRAGSKVEPVFSDAQKKALYDLGKGCPGRINRIAPGVLLDSFEIVSPKAEKQKGVSGLLVGVVVSLLASFAVIAYQYNLFFAPSEGEVVAIDSDEVAGQRLASQDAVGQESLVGQDEKDAALAESRAELLDKIQLAEMQVNELPAVEVAVAQIEGEEAQSAAVSRPIVNVAGEAVYSPEGVIQSSNATVDIEEVDADDGPPVAIGAPKATETAKVDSSLIKASSESAIIEVKESIGGGSEISKDQALEDKASNRHARFRDDKWISSQQKGAYTIQVLGSRNEQTAIKYVESERSSKELVYIESLYKDKPWFVVVFGVYPNKAAARAKMDQLPPSVKKQKPWIRSLKGL